MIPTTHPLAFPPFLWHARSRLRGSTTTTVRLSAYDVIMRTVYSRPRFSLNVSISKFRICRLAQANTMTWKNSARLAGIPTLRYWDSGSPGWLGCHVIAMLFSSVFNRRARIRRVCRLGHWAKYVVQLISFDSSVLDYTCSTSVKLV